MPRKKTAARRFLLAAVNVGEGWEARYTTYSYTCLLATLRKHELIFGQIVIRGLLNQAASLATNTCLDLSEQFISHD